MASTISAHFAGLSSDVRQILYRLQQEALVPLRLLASELTAYSAELESQARRIEFYDLETAKHAATLCHKLLAALPAEPSEYQRRLAQLAINYFVLAEDAADDDHSLIGFDDDLQVVTAVITELGLHHLLEQETQGG